MAGPDQEKSGSLINAMAPRSFHMEVTTDLPGDYVPEDAAGAFDIVYDDAEIAALGGGDPDLGLKRIIEAISADPRSFEEIIMDPRRPLQDELDVHFPPPPPEVLN